MRSWQLVKHGGPLAVVEGEAPRPAGTEVLVRVTCCGVCHSDLHFWDGYYNLGGDNQLPLAQGGVVLPFTMGHEVAGEVEAVGPDAIGVAVGDRRIVYPWIGCGDCRFCHAGDEMLCSKPGFIGVFRDGGYSTHVLVPDARYLVPHDGIPAEIAGVLACSGVTAYAALKKTDAFNDGDDIVIIGLGGVGLMALNFASQLIGGDVIAADIDEAKREAALDAGARDAVDNADHGAAKMVKSMTAGGAAAVIDFVGSEATSQFGLNCLRKGGTLVCVGLFGGVFTAPLVLMPLASWNIRGSYVGTLEDLRSVIELIRSGAAPAFPIDERGLDQANAALVDLQRGNVLGRVVLKP